MGHALLEIQRDELYKGEHLGFRTWQDFLQRDEGFPRLTGLRWRTAYYAIGLAQSATLAAMTPKQRAAVAGRRNVGDIVRMEAAGALTPAIIEQAQTQDRKEFREAHGVSKGVLVTKWLADVTAGKALQKIVDMFSVAPVEQLAGLAEVLATPEAIAYVGGRGGLVELVTATITTDLAQQLALMDPLDRLICERQGWKCAHCGKIRALGKHHRQFRSHGGTDHPDNLVGLCWQECHPDKHRQHSERPMVMDLTAMETLQ